MKQTVKTDLKNLIRDWSNKWWFALNIFCTIVYLIWRIFFTIPFGYGFVSVFVGVALLIVETLGMVEALVHYANMYNTRDYPKPDVPLELFPDVDVFISTYNEDIVLLAKTICACKRMEYPDKNKVHIYLCDDGHRETMKMLASQLGVNYLDRETHEGQKAGNLNNALAHSSSPYILTLDADMLPQSCFLMETMPYCVDAELRNKDKKPEDQIKLGFIQTPQAFYDLDLFQLKRYFPRIEIHNALSYDSASGRGMAKIIDFNYQFFLIDGEPVDDEITFELAGYELRTKRCRKIRNMCLYEVQNFQELYENQDVCDEIMEAILKLRGQQTEEPVVEKKKNNMHSFNEMDLV